MANLKQADESLAHLYSFSATCKTEQEAMDELIAKGWTKEQARAHVDAAIRGGAYATSASIKAQEAGASKGEGK